jgi:hypothetical protein
MPRGARTTTIIAAGITAHAIITGHNTTISHKAILGRAGEGITDKATTTRAASDA